LDTKKNGFFIQDRVGKGGRIFRVIKIRTMCEVPGMDTTVTMSTDQRITALGRFWRKTKIDELPQLINVLKGDMSFVGPRPDVPGYADTLTGEDRIVLSLRPGITGPATLKYRDEEEILARLEDPERYNKEIIWPDKIRLNKEYVQNWSFWNDLKYIWYTVIH
jgi:lipopolysaccharide/colanic/teichoic acid biosynthesis glycosyltransferase